MNQTFLIDGILCREIFNEMGERGGCWNFANREVTECQDCPHRHDCPADGEEE